jgi:hypothetical protein
MPLSQRCNGKIPGQRRTRRFSKRHDRIVGFGRIARTKEQKRNDLLSSQQAQAHADQVAGIAHRLVHFLETQMRNPVKSHRSTEANAKRTQQVIEGYLTVQALRKTWDSQPMAVQCRNHGYILQLRAKERKLRNILEHRATPDSDL